MWAWVQVKPPMLHDISPTDPFQQMEETMGHSRARKTKKTQAGARNPWRGSDTAASPGRAAPCCGLAQARGPVWGRFGVGLGWFFARVPTHTMEHTKRLNLPLVG